MRVLNEILAVPIVLVGISFALTGAEKPVPSATGPVFTKCRQAISRGDVTGLKQLLKEHPKIVSEKDENGETLLHIVAVFSFRENAKDDDIVDLLIERGADVNAYNKMGHTPLLEVAATRSEPVASALLRGGADVRACKKRPGMEKFPESEQHPEDGDTAIDIASCRGFPFLVERLLKVDVPIEYPKTQRLKGLPPVKDSALHFACRNCVYSKSTEKEKKDACRTIDLLCAKISDVNVKNFDGYSPLLVAADWGGPVIIDHLLSHYPKVDIDFRDCFGNSAMHLAVDGKTTPELGAEVVRVLLKHGATRDIVNFSGDTPLTIARRKGSQAIISLLAKK